MRKTASYLAMAACGWFSAAVLAGEAEGPLHVSSPDWRDQVIYFAMIDRFDDGDPDSNDQGQGEYDPADPSRFSGGDLAGLARRLDYIRGLGATALWITPPVANQWWNPRANYGGYHGYWAEDFSRVDAHFGDLDAYRDLSRRLHAAGMYLVQDVVVNHTGDYFSCSADTGRPARDCRWHLGQRQPAAPFDLNDPGNPAHVRAGLYHWTPDITDFAQRHQELDYQLAGLDDLNTENAQVRRALRKAYGDWIREAGVDAFRIDTAFYVPEEYFRDFLHSDDPQAPGVLQVARDTGREGFHAFGEGFGIDRPFEDRQARRIEGYVADAEGPLLPSMINFPLYGTLGDVFARGHASAELAWRIDNMMRVHARPHLMPTFVDNHDVDRFLAGGSEAGLKQALLAIMTLPGIPTIYYGTEQGFTRPRTAMFAGGYDAGGQDRFDPQAPLYRFLQQATALRREHRLFSRGTPEILQANAAGPGAIAWRMRHGEDSALVAFNTADHPVLLDNLETGLPAGTSLQVLFDIDGDTAAAVVGDAGRLSLRLPARAGRVWRVAGDARTGRAPGTPRPAIDGLPQAPVADDFEVAGSAPGAAAILLVVGGDIGAAQRVPVAAGGRWRATVDTQDMIDAALEHRIVAWDPATEMASAPASFRVERQWQLLAEVEDPADDDRGPDGNYRYPQDPGWAQRPGDIRRLRVYGAGGALRLELQVSELVALWNPPNGFDHVAFTVFLQLPGREGGSTVMPLQNAGMPEGMRWHYRARLHGWSNALFGAEGATATEEGTSVSPAASIAVDKHNRRVSLTFPAAALGRPETLAGARILVTTWDYDSGYRKLSEEGGAMQFGGGDGHVAPLVMDAVEAAIPLQ